MTFCKNHKLLAYQYCNFFALLFSVAVHLSLGFALGNKGYVVGAGALPSHEAPKAIVVRLPVPSSPRTSPEGLARTGENITMTVAHDSVLTHGENDKSASQFADNLIPSPQLLSGNPSEEMPSHPVLIVATPYYFRPNDLTEKPQVFQDVPADFVIELPDIAPQPAIVRLLINVQGGIDKVEIEESHLSEEAERFVKLAFAKIKFYPGKIEGQAVNSQLRIEVTLVSTGVSWPVVSGSVAP